MALWKDFAMQALDEKREQMAGMTVDQKRAVVKNVLLSYKQNPTFTVDEGMIDPAVTDRIRILQKNKQGVMHDPSASGMIDSDIKDLNRVAELQAQGVVVDEDIPLESTWKLGFGADPQKDLKTALTKHFGQDVRVVKDQNDLIYLNPETKKLTRANLGVAAEAGYGLPMAADVAGTYIVGGTSPQGRVGTTVIKESLGSGIFTTAGEGLRLVLGKIMGVHDLSYEEISERSAKTGAEAAALTGAIGGTVASVKGAYNFIKGGIFTPEEAARYGLSADQTNQVIDEVNRIIREGGGTGEMKATLAQKMDDVNLASLEAQARTSQEHGQRFAERMRQDQAAAGEAVETISRPDEFGYDPLKLREEDLPAMLREQAGPDVGEAAAAPSVLQEQAGITDRMLGPGELQTVGDVARAKVSRRVEQAKGIVAKNEAELATQMDNIGRVQKETVGAPTAEYLANKKIAEKQAADAAWQGVKDVGGFDPEKGIYNITIPQGENTRKLKSAFQRRTAAAQTRVAAGGTGTVFKEPAAMRAPGGQPLKATTAPQDLADLNREISDVKRELANIRMGRQRGTTSEKDMAQVVQAMVEDRRSALVKAGRQDILDAIEAAEKRTHDYHETYSRSVVSDLLETTETGAPVIKSKDFVDQMLKRDKTEMDDFVTVIGDDMDLMTQWKEGLADAWKTASFRNGRYNKEASQRWVRTNKENLSRFFTPAEISSMQKTGEFAQKVEGQTKRLQEFIRKANTKWGSGALQKTDPEGLTRFITGKGGSWATPSGRGVQERISKIKYVKNMTADHPAAWRRVQNDFKQIVRDDIVDPATGRIKPNKIASWASDADSANVVKEVLGANYLKNLRTINEAVKIINKKEHRLTSAQAVKGTIQAIRAGVAPPLTQRGRLLTAIITFSNATAQKRAADSLLDDVAMKEVAELLKHDPNSRRFLEKAVSLGFMVPDDLDEEE